MKYYIYISDAKVDMLFPQVPHVIKKKVATEWKIDLKVLSTSRKTETEMEDNRIARLDAVVDYIREYGNVGSVDQPDQYIEDTLAMRWGPYGLSQNPPVFFCGETTETLFGLGGSMQHVIGSGNQGTPLLIAQSSLPILITLLKKESGREERGIEGTFISDEGEEIRAIESIETASGMVSGPKQKVEFLAKRLLQGRGSMRRNTNLKPHVVLATPLYVALAD